MQLLKDLVSWLSPAEYSMIDCFFGDAVGILYCPFWSSVLQYGARLQIHPFNYWTVQPLVPVYFTECVFECDITHRRSVSVLCVLYKIRLKPLHPLSGAPPERYTRTGIMCHCGLHAVLWSHICVLVLLFAAEPRSAGGLFSSQYLYGKILLTLYSMVLLGLVVLSAEPFYWPNYSS